METDEEKNVTEEMPQHKRGNYLNIIDLEGIQLSPVQEKSSSSDPLTKSKDKSGSNEMTNLISSQLNQNLEQIEDNIETLKNIAKKNNSRQLHTGIRRLQTSQEFNFVTKKSKEKQLKKSTSKDLSYRSKSRNNRSKKSHRRVNSTFSSKQSRSILKKRDLADTKSYFSQMTGSSQVDSKKVSFKPTKTVFYIKKYNK